MKDEREPDREDAEETPEARVARALERVQRGGAARYHAKNAEQGKLFARERLALLLDPGSFVEDGALANALDPSCPPTASSPALGAIDGRAVCVMANDSTVKAGSWGARTVEKILRIQEMAGAQRLPLFYLVDSAGARITDQIEMFPGRRGAGRIFHNEVHLSGRVPQVCLLFGPSAAGGAYIPAFCDVVVMVEGNASMYLGSPRMAEMVIGEKVTLEEMGGARMHCSVSGCGDFLVKTEEEAIALARRWFSLPAAEPRASCRPAGAGAPGGRLAPRWRDRSPRPEPGLRHAASWSTALVDEGSFLEVKRLWAGELLTGLARIDGRVVGVVANQPKVKGGVLFVDSADKAARFIWLCDAFNVPLLYLADVPGLHDRHQGRAGRDHPRRRQDDQRRLRGHRAAHLRGGAQGLRGRPLRHGRPGLRPLGDAGAARRP